MGTWERSRCQWSGGWHHQFDRHRNRKTPGASVFGQDRALLCRSGQLWTHDPSSSASRVLELCMPPHPGTISLSETADDTMIWHWVFRLDILGLGPFALPFISYFSARWGWNGGIASIQRWSAILCTKYPSTEVCATANTAGCDYCTRVT